MALGLQLTAVDVNTMPVGETLEVKTGNRNDPIVYLICRMSNEDGNPVNWAISHNGYVWGSYLFSDPALTVGRPFTYWQDTGAEGINPRLTFSIIDLRWLEKGESTS